MALSVATPFSTGSRKAIRLMTVDQLRSLPPKEWLVEASLPSQGLVCLFGASGVGKSFVALDLSLSVATGRPWLGMETRQGSVVYVAAEGATGLAQRILAWELSTGTEVGAQFLISVDAVQLRDSESIDALLFALGSQRPALIVLDTLARCFVGADENSSKEMGEAVSAIDRLIKATSAVVLLVHHSGKRSGSERGSSALRGAADAMFQVEKTSGGLVLVCDKQKDAEPMPKVKLHLRSIGVGVGTSCVVERDSGLEGPRLAKNELQALAALAGHGDGLQFGKWLAAVSERLGEVLAEGTFRHWRDRLLEQGYVETPKRSVWKLTAAGRLILPSATELPLAA